MISEKKAEKLFQNWKKIKDVEKELEEKKKELEKELEAYVEAHGVPEKKTIKCFFGETGMGISYSERATIDENKARMILSPEEVSLCRKDEIDKKKVEKYFPEKLEKMVEVKIVKSFKIIGR